MEMRLGRANLDWEKGEGAGIRAWSSSHPWNICHPWMPEGFPPALGPGGIFHPTPPSWSGGSHSCWALLPWLFPPTCPTKPALIHDVIPDPSPSFCPFQHRQMSHLLHPTCWDTTSSRLGKSWPPDPNTMIFNFFFPVVLSCWFLEGSTCPQHSQTSDDFIPVAWLSTVRLLFHSPKPPSVMKHKNHGMLDVYLISFPQRRSLII